MSSSNAAMDVRDDGEQPQDNHPGPSKTSLGKRRRLETDALAQQPSDTAATGTGRPKKARVIPSKKPLPPASYHLKKKDIADEAKRTKACFYFYFGLWNDLGITILLDCV